MSSSGWLVLTGAAFVAAAWLVVGGWRQPRPALATALSRLHRRPAAATRSSGWERGWPGRWSRNERLLTAATRWGPSLRLIDRTTEAHLTLLAAAALGGLVIPPAIAVLLGQVGAVPVSFAVPAGLSLIAAVLAPAIVHADAMSRADDVRIDVRYQLSAYLDVVIMLLAGNTGYEGALQQAAQSGDGLLFRRLRRRMREAGTTGHSLVGALARTADDFALVELEQVAATTSLAAAQGAPVARTLAAKCSTLRGTIAAEHEAAARVRTDKVTPPLVGMALLFMALIIYPALNLN